MDVDLSDLDLPPGDTPLEVDLGIGEVRLTVPADVCVATEADVGVGEARVLGASNEGVDVSCEDRPEAPPAASRLVLDADMGWARSRCATPTTRPSGSNDFDRGSATTSTSPAATRTRTAACRSDARCRLGARPPLARRGAGGDRARGSCLLDAEGSIDLGFALFAPVACAATGAILVAAGLSREDRGDRQTSSRATPVPGCGATANTAGWRAWPRGSPGASGSTPCW